MRTAADETDRGEDAERLEGLLDEAIAKLPRRDRDAVVLRYLQGKSFAEVGEALRINENAARQRLFRALGKLRERLGTSESALGASLGMAGAQLVPADFAGRIILGLHSSATSAAKSAAVAVSRIIFMRKLKAFVLVQAVMLLVLGGAGAIVYFMWLGPRAQHRGGGGMEAASGAVVTTSPAAAETPAGDAASPDRSTPDKTLESLCHALMSADRSGVYACLLLQPNRPRSCLDASLDEDMALRRMGLAGEKVYGPDAAKLMEGELPIETVMQAMVVLRKTQGEAAAVDGKSAKITVEIPDALLESVPESYHGLLKSWSGKPIYFQLQDGAWRIDMDRSIRYVMKLGRPGNPTFDKPSDAETMAILEQMAMNEDSVAEQISNGELPQLADAQHAIQANWQRLDWKFGFTSVSTYDVPADSDQH